MTQDRRSAWVGRILWVISGGAWGAWLGLPGLFSVHLNADTFAPIFVFFCIYAFFALIGSIAGAALCVIVGGLVEKLLRHFGVGILAALSVASMVNVMALWQLWQLWQLGELVQTMYPGLRRSRRETKRSRCMQTYRVSWHSPRACATLP